MRRLLLKLERWLGGWRADAEKLIGRAVFVQMISWRGAWRITIMMTGQYEAWSLFGRTCRLEGCPWPTLAPPCPGELSRSHGHWKALRVKANPCSISDISKGVPSKYQPAAELRRCAGQTECIVKAGGRTPQADMGGEQTLVTQSHGRYTWRGRPHAPHLHLAEVRMFQASLA